MFQKPYSFNFLCALAFGTLISTGPATAQDLTVQFELFSDGETLDQSLTLEFGKEPETVLVTQFRPVPIPEDFAEEALTRLLVELISGGFDILSADDRRIADGAHARLSIDGSHEASRLVHKQELMLSRLPRPALQLMQAFRPHGNEGVAFMAALANLQARDPNAMSEEFAILQDHNGPQRQPEIEADVQSEVDFLKEALWQAERQIEGLEAELSEKSAALSNAPVAEPATATALPEDSVTHVEEPATAAALSAKLAPMARPTRDPEDEIRIATMNAQIDALRQQLELLEAMLSAAEEQNAMAEIQVQTLGAQLNAALAQLAKAASENQ